MSVRKSFFPAALVGASVVLMAAGSLWAAGRGTPLGAQGTRSGKGPQALTDLLRGKVEVPEPSGAASPGRLDLTFSNVDCSVFDNGAFGHDDPGLNPNALGFRWDGPWAATLDALFEASVAIGQEPSPGTFKVSDNWRSANAGQDKDQDFAVITPVAINPTGDWDDQSRAKYNDSVAESPLNVEVTEEAFAVAEGFDDDAYSHFVILQYTVKNVSGALLSGVRVGMAFDLDIPEFGDNKIGYDVARSMAYNWEDTNPDYAPDAYYVGVKVLETANVTVAGAYKPFTESQGAWTSGEWWDYLTTPVPGANDSITTISDKTFVIGTPGLNIPNNASVVVAFAVIGGSSLTDLRASADSAQSAYDNPVGRNLPFQIVFTTPGRVRGIPGVKWTWEAENKNFTGTPFSGNKRIKVGPTTVPASVLNTECDPGPITIPANGTVAEQCTLSVPSNVTSTGTFPLKDQLLAADNSTLIWESTFNVNLINAALPFDVGIDDGMASGTNHPGATAAAQYVIQPVTGINDWFATKFPSTAFTDLGFRTTDTVQVAAVWVHGQKDGTGAAYPFVIVAADNPSVPGEQPRTFDPLTSKTNLAAPSDPGFVSAAFTTQPKFRPQLVFAGVQLPVGQSVFGPNITTLSADDGDPAANASLFTTDGINYRNIPSRFGNLIIRLNVRKVVAAGVAFVDDPTGMILGQELWAYAAQHGEEAPALAGQPVLPRATHLATNYPNPFNPSTSIAFEVGAGVGSVTLNVYNLRGELVATLVDEPMEEGTYAVHWDGRDLRGEPVGSGVYLYRLSAGDYQATRKMVLAK